MRKLFVVFVVFGCGLIGAREAAAAQAADPAFDRDVIRLMEAMGSARLGEQLATVASRQVIDRMRKAQPNAPTRADDIINEVVRSKFAASIAGPDGGFRTRTIPIYEKYFTHDEVRTLLAFYATDVGRKTIAIMPTIAQEAANVGLEWANGLAPEIDAELQARFRAEGLVK